MPSSGRQPILRGQPISSTAITSLEERRLLLLSPAIRTSPFPPDLSQGFRLEFHFMEARGPSPSSFASLMHMSRRRIIARRLDSFRHWEPASSTNDYEEGR